MAFQAAGRGYHLELLLPPRDTLVNSHCMKYGGKQLRILAAIQHLLQVKVIEPLVQFGSRLSLLLSLFHHHPTEKDQMWSKRLMKKQCIKMEMLHLILTLSSLPFAPLPDTSRSRHQTIAVSLKPRTLDSPRRCLYHSSHEVQLYYISRMPSDNLEDPV